MRNKGETGYPIQAAGRMIQEKAVQLFRFSDYRLGIYLEQQSLSLLLLKGNYVEKFERIFLRETPKESAAQKIKNFLPNRRCKESILILPRSEVLVKEFSLSSAEKTDLKDVLEEKLQKLFPYSPREMAWGLSLEGQGMNPQGSVTAIPEKRIIEILSDLREMGLSPDEVITEDQVLFWRIQEITGKEPVLVLDESKERTLVLFVSQGRIIFSRSLPHKEWESGSALGSELYEDLSLALLESGQKPAKILLLGNCDSETKMQLQRHFLCPVENLETENNPSFPSFPSFLKGLAFWGKYPIISLLPRERKLQKHLQEKKRLFREIALSFFLLAGGMALALMAHLGVQAQAIEGMDKRIAQLNPEISEIKQIAGSLKLIRETESSKERILSLIKELSLNAPAPVQLEELRVEGSDFLLKGESPSHASLPEIVRILEESKVVQAPKISQTRMRKRLSEDYFEFEVTGKWAD